MSYPANIPSSPVGYGFSHAYGNGIAGDAGVHYNSADWTFLCDTAVFSGSQGDNKIHALKSTDNGLTWTEQDASHAPTPAAPSGVRLVYTFCFDAPIQYLVAFNPTSSAILGVQVWSMDLSAGTPVWSGPTSYSPPLPLGGNPQNFNNWCRLARKGAGSMVFLYNGPLETVSGTPYNRIFYATFNGSSFGAATQIPSQNGATSHYFLADGGFDQSSYLHVFAQGADTVGAFHTSLVSMSMNTGGSWGSITTVDANFSPGSDPGYVSNFAAVGSSTITVADISGTGGTFSDGSVTIFSSPSGTISPTWAQNTVSGQWNSLQTLYENKAINITAVGTTIYVAWCFNDSDNRPPLNGKFYYATASVSNLSSWSSFALLFLNTTGNSGYGAGQVYSWINPNGVAYVGNCEADGNSPGSAPPSAWAENTDFYLLGASVPPSVSCNAPPNGVVGTPYSHSVTGSGGTPPYTFTVISGSLPPGLSMASNGLISGTPTTAGTYPFTVQVTDSLSATGSTPCSITITAGTPVTVSCADLVAGMIGVPYSEPVLASGGTSPYQYVLVSGSLPPGLTLNQSTGVISGTPTATGVYSFLIGVSGTV